MFSKYIRNASSRECPVVLSITDVPEPKAVEPKILRNSVHVKSSGEPSEIYSRAREIYYRARRQRPVRAASIF